MKDEKPKTIAVGKYAQGFLLINIIEYWLAGKGKDAVLKYVKASRIPKARVYTNQIIKLAAR